METEAQTGVIQLADMFLNTFLLNGRSLFFICMCVYLTSKFFERSVEVLKFGNIFAFLANIEEEFRVPLK